MLPKAHKLAAVAPAIAAALAGVRWLLQGSGNLYTDGSHGSYQPDPDLGWRFVEQGPLWLGLDVVGALLGVTAAVFVVGWWLDRRRPAGPRWLGQGLWAVGVLSLGVPLAAFVSGWAPQGARDELPDTRVEAPTDGIQASLPGLAAGRYAVADDAALGVIVATVSAGGEEFESRFGGLRGHFTGDPADLRQPLSVVVQADPRTVDTGVELRSTHAQEYLQVEAFDSMQLTLPGLTATAAQADGSITFAADGQLLFIGDTLPVEVTGSLRGLDETARGRLGLSAAPAIKVTAGFSLIVADTKLSADATDFSSDRIPVRVELVLLHDTTTTPE